MFSKISSALFKKNPGPLIRAYIRDGKPIAVQGAIFLEQSIDNICSALTMSRLCWVFESTRTGQPTGDVELAPPEHRDRQLLTSESGHILAADLVERNIHGFRRFVAIYGGNDDLVALKEEEDLFHAVEKFALGQESQIKALLIQYGDVVPDVVYFTPGVDPEVDNLVPLLGLPPLADIASTPYKEMRGEDLETAMTYLSCAEHEH